MAFAPRGFTSFRTAMPVWIGEKLFQKDLLRRELERYRRRPRRSPTSYCLPSIISAMRLRAFFPSPFEEAAVLTMDGVGEWATTSAGIGRGSRSCDHEGDPFSAFARAALLGVHLLHRLQGQFRRVQGHGPRALRRAKIRADQSSTISSTSSRTALSGSIWTISTMHRADDDQSSVSMHCSAVRRASPRSR